MSFLTTIINDLREKKLWPIAAALLAAVVAVPVLLSSSGSSSAAPIAALPSTGPLPPAATGIPAVTVTDTASTGKIRGRARDPFTQPKSASSGSSKTSGSGSGSGSTGAASGGNTSFSGTSNGGTSTTSTTTTPTTTTTPATTTTTTTTPPPPPLPVGLTPAQSYTVALSITNSSGGLDAIDPVERLSVLPSEREPLLVELGVLKGARRVLFAVQPGTIVRGAGTCTPGPIDCQVVSLALNKIEALAVRTTKGVKSVALFAVTGITAQQHASSSSALKLRKRESTAGRRLLKGSALSALSLFRYEPSLGALVDLRNLGIGG